jgi:hypothetical protein
MAIGLILGVAVLAVVGIWFWGVLVGYVGPKDAGERKDVVQTFALIAAGMVGAIGGIVGIANLQTSRRNLQQQRELEEQRAQEDALQSYFVQIGDLLTDHNVITTERNDIKQLARSQTLTVLARLDGPRKGSLVRFLYGAALINRDHTIVQLSGADLSGADLYNVVLYGANLSGANLSDADLRRSLLLQANLDAAVLIGANLYDATVIEAQLEFCQSLEGATMPNGQKYEDWVKTAEKKIPRSLD